MSALDDSQENTLQDRRRPPEPLLPSRQPEAGPQQASDFDFGAIAVASPQQIDGEAADPVQRQTHVRVEPGGLQWERGVDRPLQGTGPGEPAGDTRESANAEMPRRNHEDAVQRMVAIGKDLYYDDANIWLPQDKAGKKSEWKANLERLTGKKATDISGENLVNMKGVPKQPQGVRSQAIKQVRNDSRIFEYGSDGDFKEGRQSGVTEMLRPKDMLDEEDDLAVQYDRNKGCVLQALVNIGVENPELNQQQQTDVASWHKLYYVTKGIQYDDDVETYQIYKQLGLELILNRRIKWKNIDTSLFKPGGKYVFAMSGHNFGVEYTQNGEFRPKDEPQRRVVRYEPELLINYVWYKPG
jgi:hypothetical protein